MSIVDELTQEAESLGMYDDFTIEKDVPLPERGRLLEKIAGALSRMEIGDSVFIRCAPGQSAERAHIGSLWHMAARFSGKKTTTRTVDGGIRVWRSK